MELQIPVTFSLDSSVRASLNFQTLFFLKLFAKPSASNNLSHMYTFCVNSQMS